MGGAVFPPYSLALGQTIVGVIVVMGPPSKELTPTHWAPRTFVISAPDPAAGHCWHTPPPETPRHSQASLAQSLMASLLLSPREGNSTPFSTLAWKIPWTEEPGRLQSMGSLGVGHDWATSLSLFFFFFLSFFNLFLNWRKIALQCCIGFSVQQRALAIIIHIYLLLEAIYPSPIPHL